MMSAKPKVLVLSDWFVPGYKAGGPIRSVSNLTKHLSNEIDFYILTSDRDLGDSQPYDGIQTNTFYSTEYGNVCYASPGNEAEILGKAIQEQDFDHFYLNSLFSLKYTILPLWGFLRRGELDRVVLAPRGMLGEGALQIKGFKKKIFLTVFKLLGVHKKVLFHATDDVERKSIEKAFGTSTRINVIGNISVSLSEWKARENTKKRFIFSSRISPKKNLHFLIDVWKEAAVADAELSIFGFADDPNYEALCKAKSNDDPSIKWHGAVEPDELYKELKNHHFFVLPTLNENFGHSIVEALSFGCPVLISDQTPWNDAQEKEAGWVCKLDERTKWVDNLRMAASMDPSSFEAMSRGAQTYISGRLGLSTTMEGYRQLFSSRFSQGNESVVE